MKVIILFLFAFLNFNDVFSVEPDEILKDDKLENIAREIGKNLRCLVCQNEDIENSNADIAKDLRILVRKKLLEGESKENIISFVHKKYGDFVLFSPPIRLDTIWLWGLPVIFFFFLFYLLFKRR